MRVLLFIILLTISLFAIDIKVNNSFYKGKPFSILHIKYDIPFQCEDKKTLRKRVYETTCTINKPILSRFATKSNKFFKISSNNLNDKFIIKVEALQNIHKYPIENELKDSPTIKWDKSQTSKHWVFIGYSDELPIIEDKEEINGVNFPIGIMQHSRPYIGNLDLNKKPIQYETASDAKTMVQLEELYKAEKYLEVLELVNDFTRSGTYTEFESDLGIYKIRASSKIITEDNAWDILTLIDKWIKKYPSNQYLAEALAYKGLALFNIKQEDPARDVLQKIIDNHKDSKFIDLARVYMSDIIREDTKMANRDSVTERLLLNALYNTKDLEIASMASMRLGKLYYDTNDYEKASQFYDKVLKANSDFFIKDLEHTHQLAIKLSLKKAFKIAADIGANLLKKAVKTSYIYEMALNDTARWYAEAGDIEEAIKFYQKYLKEFKDGEFVAIVKRELDLLVFKSNNDDPEVLLEKYDKVIQSYKNEPIAIKAKFQKAKLLAKIKKFQEALDTVDTIIDPAEEEAPDFNNVVKDIATNATKNFLENDCITAVQVIDKYNVTLDSDFDNKLFYCYYNAFEYQDAIDIANKYVSSTDLNIKTQWLYNMEKAMFKKGDYESALKTGEDVISLFDFVKTEKYNDIYYDMFFNYVRFKNSDKIVETVKKIEDKFEANTKSIKMYKKMIQIGTGNRDNYMIIEYARKLMKLQDRLKMNQESPWVETIAMNTLLNLERPKDALKISEKLLRQKLTKEEKAKALYTQANIYQKLDDKKRQKVSLEKCSKIDISSSWVNLCKDSLKWLVD
jgi:tetratricopeptide (TPR) repeat protein